MCLVRHEHNLMQALNTLSAVYSVCGTPPCSAGLCAIVHAAACLASPAVCSSEGQVLTVTGATGLCWLTLLLPQPCSFRLQWWGNDGYFADRRSKRGAPARKVEPQNVQLMLEQGWLGNSDVSIALWC